MIAAAARAARAHEHVQHRDDDRPADERERHEIAKDRVLRGPHDEGHREENSKQDKRTRRPHETPVAFEAAPARALQERRRRYRQGEREHRRDPPVHEGDLGHVERLRGCEREREHEPLEHRVRPEGAPEHLVLAPPWRFDPHVAIRENRIAEVLPERPHPCPGGDQRSGEHRESELERLPQRGAQACVRPRPAHQDRRAKRDREHAERELGARRQPAQESRHRERQARQRADRIGGKCPRDDVERGRYARGPGPLVHGRAEHAKADARRCAYRECGTDRRPAIGARQIAKQHCQKLPQEEHRDAGGKGQHDRDETRVPSVLRPFHRTAGPGSDCDRSATALRRRRRRNRAGRSTTPTGCR